MALGGTSDRVMCAIAGGDVCWDTLYRSGVSCDGSCFSVCLSLELSIASVTGILPRCVSV